MEILENFGDKSIFETDFDEPVPEILQQKRASYAPQNPLINLFNTSPVSTNIGDDQINELAVLDVEYSILKINFLFGAGKGLVSAISFNKTDENRLNELIDTGETATSEAKGLLELQKLAEKCKNQTFENESAIKAFLITAKKAEMRQQREAGTLKIHGFDYYVNRIIMTQFAQLFGSNPKLINTVISKGISSIKNINK